MADENKTLITILDAIGMVADSAKKYTDDTVFSGDFNDLTNKPEALTITRDEFAQATDDEVISSILNIFEL